MRAKKTETEQRQEQIIEAALEIIGTEGVHTLSIVGIAERVGIVPSAIYRHFGSKDDVLDGVLEMLKSRLVGNVSQVRKKKTNSLQRLKDLLMLHTRMITENRALPHVVFSDFVYTGHPERKAKVADIMSSYLAEIQQIVEEGKQDGSIREDTTPTTASMMFLGMILPAAVLWNVTNGAFDMASHTENAWSSFSRCIAKDS